MSLRTLTLFVISIFSMSAAGAALAGLPKGMMIVGYDGDAWYPYIIKSNNSEWTKVSHLKNPSHLTWQANTGDFYIKGDDGLLYQSNQSSHEVIQIKSNSNAYTQLRAYGNGVMMVELLAGKSRDTTIVTLDHEHQINKIHHQASAQFHPYVYKGDLFYAQVTCRLECDPIIQDVWIKRLTTKNARQLTRLNATSYLHSVDQDKRFGYISSNQSGYYHIARVDIETGEIAWLTKGPVTDSFPSVSINGDLFFTRRTPDGTQLLRMLDAIDGSTGSNLEQIAIPKEIQKIRYLELNH